MSVDLEAFIGVPIVIAVLTLCKEHPASRWVNEVFRAGLADLAEQ